MKVPRPGGSRRHGGPLAAASFRTWRGWAAAVRMIPGRGKGMVLYGGWNGKYKVKGKREERKERRKKRKLSWEEHRGFSERS